jgi:catechol 2,3-dioxygenase-like lactoylglutathione lyase family enzyme
VPLHRLTDITLGVPSTDASGAFFTDFGLVETTPGNFATRDGGEQVRLVAAPRRTLVELGLGADDTDDLSRLAHRLEAFADRTGTDVRTNLETGDTGPERLVVHEPVTGLRIVCTVAAPLAPPPPPAPPVNAPGTPTQRLDRPADAVLRDTPVRPSNLTHLVYGTPDQPATLRFVTEGLGFEVSDEVPGIIAFARCGEVHHELAIQAAPVPYVHHIAFEVDDVDEVARGGTAMIERDPGRQLWGIGRHAIGSNWFWYLREPGGTYVEYTADVDRISAQDRYVPKVWTGHEFIYAFGPPPPREFLEPDDLAELIAAG